MSRAQGMRIALQRERKRIKELLAQVEALENQVDYLKGMIEEAQEII